MCGRTYAIFRQSMYDCPHQGPFEPLRVDSIADPAETEMVGDYKGVYPIVLGQVRVGFLELPDLLGVVSADTVL